MAEVWRRCAVKVMSETFSKEMEKPSDCPISRSVYVSTRTLINLVSSTGLQISADCIFNS